ncbi:mesoderm induction early response protein [Parasponia andersonii]|uniref:Mesoderm induction early response protein n=1 Tax=Parasponia andersonii TaxID=3476 RepID=A0A2P5CQH1_PARAD|nr:mesoderm induction early response protein [Parasponia andersonii]
MADKEGLEENASRGNEWEVVSLTASTYAAAPGPDLVESNDDGKGNTYEEEAETSHALFMSGHFVFPPSQHENLPLEPDNSTIHDERQDKDVVTALPAEEGGRSSGKDEENWPFKELTVTDEFPGIPFFDEKGKRLPFHGTDFEEGTNLQGLNLIEAQNVYNAARYSSFQTETTLVGSAPYGEETAVEPSEQDLDAGEIARSPKLSKEDKHDGSGLPCEAWWRRGAASLYSQAKEANTFWSIFVAAAVMGLVIIGQHWQQERWQALQLKWQFSLNNEKTGRLFGPISRLKDVIVGQHRRGSLIRGSSSSEN